MAPTTYSAIQSVDYDNYEADDVSTVRLARASKVAAVVCAVVCMFFAGRVYEGETIGYSHEEVMDIAAKCGEGEFIGGCVSCKDCAPYEFANGGCSFFKDRFCTYCEPIRHCKREKILCSTREDQICLSCDCDDPIGNWTDIDLDDYIKYEMFDREEYKGISQVQATFSCYWNEQCLPCTVCELGHYQTVACTHASDTECRTCTDCTVDQWVSKACNYFEDTVCSDCTHFYGAADPEEKWTSQKCYRFESTGPLYEGSDAVSSPCADREGRHAFYSAECTEFTNSELTDCYDCADDRTCNARGGEYIREDCVYGTKAAVGVTTLCNKCTNQEDMPNHFEHKGCFHDGHEDAEWTPCATCLDGEWEHTPCRLSTQTICGPCYPVNGCKTENTVCSIGRAEDDNDSECMGTPATTGGEAPIAPWFMCEAGYMGKQCHYMQTHADCGVGAGYRERTAKTGKFRGKTNDEYIAWCAMLCDEFPDCTGFEIDDYGDDVNAMNENTKLTKPNSLCSLKNMNFGSVVNPSDPSKECFANTRRQRETVWRDVLNDAGIKAPKPFWYVGVGQPGFEPIPADSGNAWIYQDGKNTKAPAERSRQYDNIGPKDPVTGKWTIESSTQVEAMIEREAECGYPDESGEILSRIKPGLANEPSARVCDADCAPHLRANDNKTPGFTPL